jgi:two-component system, response regulator PdtaR
LTVKRTILVVEDDFLIRAGTADMIKDLGFDVFDAANADEALAILEQSMLIDIVFTDIQMPGSMDGLRLIACVRDRWPPIALLVTSGQIKPPQDHMPSGSRFLSKPYQQHELQAHLEALLN